MVDVEEGEISDTESVEEITEKDFKKVGDVETPPAPASTTRVWTMRDLYEYQMTGRGYVTGLCNLAWAQAVQNKPLDEVIVEVIEPPAVSSSSSSGEKKVETVTIDVEEEEEEGEKEEGELEEGEIDLEEMNVDVGGGEKSKVEMVKEALGSVSVEEVEKSFDAGCANLQAALEGWREVAQQDDGVVQLLVSAVRVVSSVFGSMDCKLKEQNKDIFLRLISAVKADHSANFSPEQIKELDVMIASAHANDARSTMFVGKGEVLKDTNVMTDTDKDSVAEGAVHYNSSNNSSISAVTFVLDKPSSLQEASKSNFRSRAGVLRPLLDLHKVHDLDSLPSPTREMTHSFPAVHKMPNMMDEMSRPGLLLPKVDAVDRMHPYETDAAKAVSSYQQRFSRSSFFSSDSLPSPTPSEDSANTSGGDIGGEVTSSRNSGPPALSKVVASPAIPFSESSIGVTIIPAKAAVPLSSGSVPTLKPSTKSRDPRLRFLNHDPCSPGQDCSSLSAVSTSHNTEPVGGMMSMRKNKLLDDPIADGPMFKRRRNMLESSANDRKTANGSGGWLEDNDMVGPQSLKNGNNWVRIATSDPRRTNNMVTISSGMAPIVNVGVNEQIHVSVASSMPGNGQVPMAGAPLTSLPEILKNIAVNPTMLGAPLTSLPEILKNIAVNPTMLMNILKMGQQQKLEIESQNLANQAKSGSNPLSSNSTLGAIPGTTDSTVQPSIVPRPAGASQPSQPASVDEAGKTRMKPRDPRRALHINALQRTGGMSGDPLRTNVTPLSIPLPNKDSQHVQKQEGQADKKLMTSQPSVLPDISLPFTHSLNNIADIVSVSQGSATQPLDSPVPPSQPIPVKADKCDVNAVGLKPDQTAGAASAREVAVVASHPQNAWGDVEHLFEGYDDKQKAAIQRERARRIEEQRKMFAARKLCLVLDLDHTLLNSAKYAEVDPAHDEILRKKEEQDREKPFRHLFRFPHMAMWTKLRPGIWNFLEKASKLFELHLYTMGNKLYATEMAKVLDPKGILFAGRVISRGDDGEPFDGDERVPKSKDLEGVLGMESAVVIVDDSVRVWPHNKLNLIAVERYIYFPCSRHQFGLPGPSLLEIDHDERPEDGTLACSLAVIERLHQNFFNHQSLEEADVRNILASEQRKILAGCRIVFSRVFPVGEANPHLHPLWQTAEQFGAICTNQMDDQVTHVVANSLGTDKVNWALSSGKFVVHPGWVEASALLYRRANEQDFAIKQ